MKKPHLWLAAFSALGLVALSWAGGPAGTLVRLGPLEWSFASAPGAGTPVPEILERFADPREPVS